jgi:hypothetical protein
MPDLPGLPGSPRLAVRSFFTINQGHAYGAPGRPASAGLRAWRGVTQGSVGQAGVFAVDGLGWRGSRRWRAAGWPTALARERTARATAAAPFPRTRRLAVPAVRTPG